MSRFILPTIAVLVLAGASFGLIRKNDFQVAYSTSDSLVKKDAVADAAVENQKPMENPPKVIKAIYLTSWSAGSIAKLASIINLVKSTELNAVVIDLKDYSGIVSYNTANPLVLKYKTKQARIPDVNALIKTLHANGIYAIGRITVFQDPLLAKARPDLAVQNPKTGAAWADRKGLSWIDPGAVDGWKYNVSIAKDAADHGFDEINFDYIRFPSDGDLSLMRFANSDLTKETKAQIIRRFLAYLRNGLPGVKISADLFGLTTVNHDDLGIGQVLEYAFENFDYVAPMIYPSHFANGFIGFQNPADHPYEVIQYAMERAVTRLVFYQDKIETDNKALSSTAINDASGDSKANPPPSIPVNLAKLRPWLQSFDLGAVYDAAKIKTQIKAVYDSFCSLTSVKITPGDKSAKPQYKEICEPLTADQFNNAYNGWMLWDPANNYIKSSLELRDK